MIDIFLERANNEISAAESLKKLSENEKAKIDFQLSKSITFYSSVISHSYYAIFYAAKAILLTKGIKPRAPGVHKKTYETFDKTFVQTGILDRRLIMIYGSLVIMADELLEIFKDEKWKRGHFTYTTIPQTNKSPADESLKNAKVFVSNITKVLNR
ncbi:MAG: HEPN domain-containing protein [Candidatus Aenigmatarchaeota archaeon]